MVKGDKKRTTARLASSDDEQDKLDEILSKLSRLDEITGQLSKMEALLEQTQAENEQLKITVNNQSGEIRNLKLRLNSIEQHNRSFSIRINNFPLDGINDRDPPVIMNKVYSELLLPILTGAASKRAISSVPSCYEAIEMAHVLPGKPDKPKPIIMRFFNRNLKSVLFSFRKEFAPSTPGPSSSHSPRYKYPFHDDLTRDTFQKMKSLQGDSRVQACWATGGSLSYTLVDSPTVIKRVQSVYDTNEFILK